MTSTLPNDNIRNFDDQITNKLISEIIRDRIKNSGTRFSANDNISDFINPGELEILEKEVASRVKDLLKSLVIDVENDHNTQETAERVSKMYLNEVFKGRYHEQPKVTSFPNDKNLDEIYTVGPISVRSACSHHLVPILGECWIGIKPGNKVIGLSKFARVADWVFSRPHYCMKWRGVKEPNTSMINSVVRGDFRHDLSLKQEFFELVKQQSATNNY